MREHDLFQLSEKSRALPYIIDRMGTPVRPEGPVSMTLRPTSVCNRRCNFCLCGSRNIAYHDSGI